MKEDLKTICEESFAAIQRGSAVVPALFEAISRLQASLSPEIVKAFEKMRGPWQAGEPLNELFKKSPFFQDRALQTERILIEQGYRQPTRAKVLWLDWLKGRDPISWQASEAVAFLKEFLRKEGPLWIASENKNALQVVKRHLGEAAVLLVGENYESLEIACREKAPKKSQLVLWVDSDSAGQTVLSGLDEVVEAAPGRFQFQRVYELRAGWVLAKCKA